MTDREKLVEIICEAMREGECVAACNYPPCYRVENAVDFLLANGVTVQEPIRKAEDCRCYTKTNYGGGCLGTKELDPCKGPTCERWRRRG